MTQTHAKWPLPEVVNPPDSICFQIRVPNDRRHIGAFLGAIYELSKPYAWQNDTAHTALAVGAVWLKIFDKLVRGCPCPTPAPLGKLEDFDMPLRVDCNCNIFITCCDGTEKQILNGDQVKALIAGPAVNGAPQPPAGGGCQDYGGHITNNALALVPTTVSAGDTIRLLSALGASNAAGTLDWLCPNGSLYFAGECGSTTTTSGTTLLPTAPVGCVLVKLGSSYFQLTSSVLTVPVGHTNEQPALVLNYDPTLAVSGDITFSVEVCNNAPTNWSHNINLTLTPAGFAAAPLFACSSGNQGSWVAGIGWVGGCCDNAGTNYGLDIIRWDFPSLTSIDSIEFRANGVIGANPFGATDLDLTINKIVSGVPTSLIVQPLVTANNQSVAWTTPFTANGILFEGKFDDETAPTACTGKIEVITLIVTGHGPDPF